MTYISVRHWTRLAKVEVYVDFQHPNWYAISSFGNWTLQAVRNTLQLMYYAVCMYEKTALYNIWLGSQASEKHLYIIVIVHIGGGRQKHKHKIIMCTSHNDIIINACINIAILLYRYSLKYT